uniref:Major facilitator superfamily associated domain-containing protein n=2 Tax=Strongyloides stercoralis TaxID=6248 RepID=A0AAF5CYN3_STRER
MESYYEFILFQGFLISCGFSQFLISIELFEVPQNNQDISNGKLVCSTKLHTIKISKIYELFFLLIQILISFLLYYLKKKQIIQVDINNNDLEEYNNISHNFQQNPLHKTFIIFSSLMIFSLNCLDSSFIFTTYYCIKNEKLYSNLNLFLLFLIISKVVTSYSFIRKHQIFILTASISTCSMASCLFNFSIPIHLIYILYGIGIGPIFPTIISYLKLSDIKNINYIFMSKTLATFLSPLIINKIINIYGKNIYPCYSFLWALAYILFFVGVLNYHASKSHDNLNDEKYKIWYIFFGNKTKIAKKKVRKVMRSFRNKSFKAMNKVRYNARTWSTKKVNTCRQNKKKDLNQNNEEIKIEEKILPSEGCDVEIYISESN